MHYRWCVIVFASEVKNKKIIPNTQAVALFWIRSLKKKAVPVDAEISTYPLYSASASEDLDLVDMSTTCLQ